MGQRKGYSENLRETLIQIWQRAGEGMFTKNDIDQELRTALGPLVSASFIKPQKHTGYQLTKEGKAYIKRWVL